MRAKQQEVDMEKVELTAWAIVSKESQIPGSSKFSEESLFKLWQVFNKHICDETVSVHVEEIALILEEYMKALGVGWDAHPLEDFSSGKTCLSFWEFISCLETEYIFETPMGVYLEGLDALEKRYLREVLKEGWLRKKGDKVKSMKDRWFVYTPHSIAYYEKEDLSSKKGEIVINAKSEVENVPDTRSNKCHFKVKCGISQRLYEIEAADQKTKNEWMSVIKLYIGIDDNVTPLMVELSKRADKRKEKVKKEEQAEEDRLKQEELIKTQMKELEETKKLLGEAHLQAETEAALKEEEKKKREEMEVLKAEYEKLLEEERLAREEENKARLLQEEMLANETSKRLELERIKSEQDSILEAERKMREGLEELSKEQMKTLEQERERLSILEKAQKAAEEELANAHGKLEAVESDRQAAANRVELAKQKTRNMSSSVGLSGPIRMSQAKPTTHRGAGAFHEDDFKKMLSSEGVVPPLIIVNSSEVMNEEERLQIVETNLVKPSDVKDSYSVL